MQHREMFVCDEVQYNFSLNDNILDTNFWKAKNKFLSKLNRKITKKLLEKKLDIFL